MTKLGVEQLSQANFGSKRIGLLTNHTGLVFASKNPNSSFESTIDILHRDFNLVKLFAPEHGVRGNLQAGVTLDGYIDERTGLPVVSLYGATRRPTVEMLADIDVFAFDIQDVGSRFYTYMYSMAYAMEACAANGKEFVVFDRPNPLGDAVEGNLLEPECKSFIGLYPMPQRYGLTIGECAMLFNTEFGIGCNLTVVKMENYTRNMYWEDTGLPWVLPSPNIPTPETCFVFNATCIFEGTNVSEGRGTTKPFHIVGAPWLNGQELADELAMYNLPGVHFRPHYFTPVPYLPNGKCINELCGGVEVHVTDQAAFRPVKTGVTMLYTIKKLGGKNFAFLPPYHDKGKHMIDYNTGGTYVREGMPLADVLALYEKDAAQWRKLKRKYELYSELTSKLSKAKP